MKKALLIRFSSLGDVIFNIPLANVLKNNGYEVTWMVSEKGYDVVKDNPAVKNTVLVPFVKWRENRFNPYNYIEFLKILYKIRKEKFDVALDCQMMFKSMVWMKLCRAKRKICYKNGREYSHLGGNERVSSPPIDIFKQHAIFHHLYYAKYLGLEGADDVKFTLPENSAQTKEKIDLLLSDIDKSKPLVVIAPATTWKLKHWNKDNWKTLVNAIKDKCSIVFTGTNADKELISYIGGDNFLSLAGKTGLKDLTELFSRAALVIAPDSGSSHLARAVDIPAVISIFCCTPPKMYGPFGNDDKYFALNGNLNCQPCHKRVCPLEGDDAEKCINFPEPEKIINIVNKVLQNSKHSV